MGETYSAMMDLKSAKLRRVGGSSPPAALVAKINALVELSVNSFKQFLTLLKTSPDAEMPKKFDKDVCRPALLAHFHLGRLSDKYQGMSGMCKSLQRGSFDRACIRCARVSVSAKKVASFFCVYFFARTSLRKIYKVFCDLCEI